MIIRLAAGAALALGLTLSAVAQEAGPWGSVTLHNQAGFTIASIQTSDDQTNWSDNWLKAPLAPGATASVAFGREGPCVVPVLALDDKGQEHRYFGNFCGTANLYLGESDASWD